MRFLAVDELVVSVGTFDNKAEYDVYWLFVLNVDIIFEFLA